MITRRWFQPGSERAESTIEAHERGRFFVMLFVSRRLPVIGIISWYNGCAMAIAWIEIRSSTKQLVSGTKSRGRTSMCSATMLWLRMSWKVIKKVKIIKKRVAISHYLHSVSNHGLWILIHQLLVVLANHAFSELTIPFVLNRASSSLEKIGLSIDSQSRN